MNTLSATTSLLAHSLSWALLYSLWQGLLIYTVLYVLLKAMPNIQARIKYLLSMGSLTALFVWFADTWFSQYQRLKGITVYITQAGADTGTSATYTVKAMAGDMVQIPLLYHIVPYLEHYFPFIITLYSLGLIFMLARFIVNAFQVNALRKQGITAPGAHWDGFLLQWQKHFEITRPVKLFLSSRVNTPVMLGAIKPIILLPVAAISNLTTEQVESILIHELAHIKRHDYLLNIFQVVAETILFFNPFVWFLSGIIRKEREHCCDDLVLACATNPLPYAKALAILENDRSHTNWALAATGHKNQLFNRIKRIMEMKKTSINNSQLTIIIIAVIVITFTVAMFTFTPSFAQKAKKDSDDTIKKNVYHYKTVIVDSNGKKTVTEKQGSMPEDDESKDDQDNEGTNKGSKNVNTKTYSYTYTYSSDDLDKAMDDVKTAVNSIANIDLKEIEKQIDISRKEIDAVDWNAVKEEINKGLDEVNKELNDPKLHKEINTEVKKALEKSKETMEDVKEKLSAMPPVPPLPPTPPQPPAKPHAADYEAMLRKMEKEGLIDRSEDYRIKTENGVLYINDKKQSPDIYKKYQHYLESKNVSIKYHNGILKINAQDE